MAKEKIDIKHLKKWLGPGDISEIAAEVGVTVKTVGNTLHGRSWNWAVADKIIERAEKNRTIVSRAELFKREAEDR
jgi:hypothetical protein